MLKKRASQEALCGPCEPDEPGFVGEAARAQARMLTPVPASAGGDLAPPRETSFPRVCSIGDLPDEIDFIQLGAEALRAASRVIFKKL